MLLFTETWCSQSSNIDIDGYDKFVCNRPKYNRRSKRDSGGIVVYFKSWLFGKIELIKSDNRGIVWFKLDKKELGFNDDIYFCVCYIPPENSMVYKNVHSNLYECDFFEILNDDILIYSDKGTVFLTGDTNSRVGEKHDFIDDMNLNRYVYMPENYSNNDILPTRCSNDKIVNTFGTKLLTLCKENDLHIVNGRLENGDFTCFTVNRISTGASVVDYLITNVKNFDLLDYFNVLDLNEHSDHCPLNFALKCDMNVYETTTSDKNYINKIVWDSDKHEQLNNCLNEKLHVFENIVD